MKKLVAFLFASFLMALTVIGLRQFTKQEMMRKDNVEKAYTLNSDERNDSYSMLQALFQGNVSVVLGSSELSASDSIAYPPYLFGDPQTDFKMVLMGRGYMQSLHHAITVAAYSDILPQRKVALILSPQWFTKEGLFADAYASRFSETQFLRMLNNPDLPENVKQSITSRLFSLLKVDKAQMKRLQYYCAAHQGRGFNPIKSVEMNIYQHFLRFKNDYSLQEAASNNVTPTAGPIEYEKLNFKALLSSAEREGSSSCSNNTFGIMNSYFDRYIREQLEVIRGSASKESYATSPEYDDLKLFLDVCKSLHVDPLIILVPVNGRWYDYTGFPKEERTRYYDTIREICASYGVSLADFSGKEYEKYFLKDVMHLGWKGWVYLDEAVHSFYNK